MKELEMTIEEAMRFADALSVTLAAEVRRLRWINEELTKRCEAQREQIAELRRNRP